jgi:hypothetical protein
VHVNVVVAAAPFPKLPLGADQLNVSAEGEGALAVADRLTELPTVVAIGFAETLFAAAQLNVSPLTRVTCEPNVAVEHASTTVTGVVPRAAIENGADPAQTTLPSEEVPESETRYPDPKGTSPMRSMSPRLWLFAVPLCTTVAAPPGPEMDHEMTGICSPGGSDSSSPTEPVVGPLGTDGVTVSFFPGDAWSPTGRLQPVADTKTASDVAEVQRARRARGDKAARSCNVRAPFGRSSVLGAIELRGRLGARVRPASRPPIIGGKQPLFGRAAGCRRPRCAAQNTPLRKPNDASENQTAKGRPD